MESSDILIQQNENRLNEQIDHLVFSFLYGNLNDKNVSMKSLISMIEERIISHSLEITNWNQKMASGILKVGQTTLNEKIKRMNIRKEYPTDPKENLENMIKAHHGNFEQSTEY